jgi:hypothetical protein
MPADLLLLLLPVSTALHLSVAASVMLLLTAAVPK